MPNPKRPDGHKQLSVWVPEELHHRLDVYKSVKKLKNLDQALAQVLEEKFPDMVSAMKS